MSWHLGPLAAFDIESTGVDPESDRIVTAAVSIVGAGRSSEHHDWLVDPGMPIPDGATAVHGISTETARAKGSVPRQAIGEIVALLARWVRAGAPIVAFNARFDLTILDREARRHAVVPLVDRIGGWDRLLVIDPYVLDKHVDRYRPGKRTLQQVCEHYRVAHEEAHSANADALAAARVAYRIASRTAELRDLELAQLHASQVQWAAEQASSLQAYFAEVGRIERVEEAWPIVPSQAPMPLAA